MDISIIIPTYNVEAYITECLESVAHQTYKDDMECLIIDDCGTDDSIALAEQFIHSYHGNIIFKIIHHEHNRGLSAARNTGVDAAIGNYVYFLDSDDAIGPETIDSMVRIIQDNPKVEMVQGGIVNMNGQVLDDFTKKELPEYIDNAEWITKNLLFNLPVSSWNRLLKRDFLYRENISFHEGIIHEDVPYCFQLALKCKHIGFVRQNTYLFRSQREGSITTNPQEERALVSRLIIMNDCIDAYSHNHKKNKVEMLLILNFIWSKWYRYLNKHCVLLPRYSKDVNIISNKLIVVTPFPFKLYAVLYHYLPLSLKGKRPVVNLFKKLFEV